MCANIKKKWVYQRRHLTRAAEDRCETADRVVEIAKGRKDKTATLKELQKERGGSRESGSCKATKTVMTHTKQTFSIRLTVMAALQGNYER